MTSKSSILQKLGKIQAELKVPKTEFNDYGKYYFRNAEGICEAAKPICAKYGVVLTIDDEITLVGERYYIKAIATVWDIETGEYHSATAFAREPVERKGMDESQITGASSSYARKYALGGLFALDDNKDPDATNTHGQEPEVKKPQVAPKKDNSAAREQLISEIAILLAELDFSPEWLSQKLQKDFKKTDLNRCTEVELRRVANGLKKYKADKQAKKEGTA